MKLSFLSIQRPIFATVVNCFLILAGIGGLLRLPVRELPDVEAPVLSIITAFPGASPRLVEAEITEKIEEAANAADFVKNLTSQSQEGVSNVTVEFHPNTSMDVASQDVRNRIARIRDQLPEDAKEPIVIKQDPDANPMLWIALSSAIEPLETLSIYARELFKDRLQKIDGVSTILLAGEKRFAARIRLDPHKLHQAGITLLEVDAALKSHNVDIPAGRLSAGDREYFLDAGGALGSLQDLEDLPIKGDATAQILLKDLGRVEAGVEDERTIARFNSKPTVGIGVVRVGKSNAIAVAKKVKQALEELKRDLPPSIQVAFPYDESVFIEEAIDDVWVALLIACFLVALTVGIFLRDWRSALIPAAVIPVAIVGTFMLFPSFGYTINIVSLMSLTLAIGIVVDDSIVVVENIARHIEKGLSAYDAAMQAMGEIALAVVATTAVLVAVFLPFAFQQSLTGRLFIEFAVTMSFAAVLSSFAALTLTPALSALWLRSTKKTAEPHWITWYQRWLKNAMQHPFKAWLWFFGIFGVSVGCFFLLPTELLPLEDKGRLFCFCLTPQGSTPHYTDTQIAAMEKVIANRTDTDAFFTAVALPRQGPGRANEGFMFVRLKEGPRETASTMLIGPQGLFAQFAEAVKGGFAIPILPKAIGLGFEQPFRVAIKGNNLAQLADRGAHLAKKWSDSGLLMNARSQLTMQQPKVRWQWQRERMAAHGLYPEQPARLLLFASAGAESGYLRRDGKMYPIYLQLDAANRSAALDQLDVRTQNGALAPLSTFVERFVTGGVNEIIHTNRVRSTVIEGTPQSMTLGQVMQAVESDLKQLDSTLSYEWLGEASALQETGYEGLLVFLFALLTIYLALAAQFESWLDPLIIMLSVPLSLGGGLAGLVVMHWLVTGGNILYALAYFVPGSPTWLQWIVPLVPRFPGMTLNLFSLIGLALLLGLATKNAILIVEFANQRKHPAISWYEAAYQATCIRLRPILMTSFSTIFGMLPIALGFGAGGDSRRPLGLVAMFGMLASLVLTLWLIPVLYGAMKSYFYPKHQSKPDMSLSDPSVVRGDE